MNEFLEENREFNGINYVETRLTKGAYEQCTFFQCIFTNSDLSNIIFVECEFVECDLSMANVSGTAFQDSSFTNCKLLGLHFEHCNDLLFSVNFKECVLNLSSFYKCSLKRSIFMDCNLQETDFTESDMTGSILQGCDLSGAIFDHTILEKADLRRSFNFSIDPELNRIRRSKFSAGEIIGLLGKYDITID